MEKKYIFEFTNYKDYLAHLEDNKPRKGRGFRSELARAAECQSAYVSQVLNGGSHLSLEQADKINALLQHNTEESRFFILLIEYARSGTESLKKHFLDLMDELAGKQLNLKERFKVKETLSFADQVTYYSDWTYTAIHIAMTISKLSSTKTLCEYFNLSKQKVERVLDFLTTRGLIVKIDSNNYNMGVTRTHVGQNSPLVASHHKNWRAQAINSLDRVKKTDLHYTSVVSLSNEDIVKIKTRLVKEIDKYRATVKDSPEESMSCLVLDFFTV